MTQVNDVMFAKLRALGYEGALPDMLDAYRRVNGIDTWRKYLAQENALHGSLADSKLRYFENLEVPES